jgi:hypothetical protein
MSDETSIENTAPEAETPPTPAAPSAAVAQPVLTASITKSELSDRNWELADWIVSLQRSADEKGVVSAKIDYNASTETFHYVGFDAAGAAPAIEA